MTAVQTRPGTSTAPRRGPVAQEPSPWRSVVTLSAIIACGLALWLLLYTFLLSGLHERHAQSDLYASFRENLSAQTAPLGGAIKPGTPVALISAPGLGFDDLVTVEGTDAGSLMDGPGHLRSTPLPGQFGISVIYGRSTLFGGPFSNIADAAKGATIKATTGQGTFTFAVRDVRHVGDPYPQPLAANQAGLTLVTAEGATLGNLGQPQNPVYVDTVLVGKTKPVLGLAGRPSDVGKSEKAMARDTSDLYVLVLLLPLVVGAMAFVAWGLARWGRWQVWVIGAPLVAATLWAASQSATHLLPNLM